MSRGRGRPPDRMLEEATKIASKRGDVMQVPGGRSDAFDIIICEEFRNVFVRFRRSFMQYMNTLDVLREYRRDITRMVHNPLTLVMAWEFWLRFPRGKWQHFLVRHDSIVEIREDGTILYRAVLPMPVADPAAEKAAPAGDEEHPGGEPGFTTEEGE